MSQNLVSPLVSFGSASRRPFSTVQPGDLITVNVYNPKSGEFDAQSGARFERAVYGNVWVRLAGLTVPEPYRIGDPLVIDQKQVVDW